MIKNILSHLPGDFPRQVHWFEEVTSTNDIAKQMAKAGAPHGTAVLAGRQTGGRGRMGRHFSSPAGMGVYLSVILRPGRPAPELMHLTCAVGTLMCDAVETVSACRPKLKWINDLILQNKKLGGILTELSIDAASGLVDYAVVGIGINCNQQKADFPAELQETAISLKMHTGKPVDMAQLAAAMIYRLCQGAIPENRISLMSAYRKDCITLGKEITVLQEAASYPATALDINDDGALLVRLCDGSTKLLQSGEVSIRGQAGYI